MKTIRKHWLKLCGITVACLTLCAALLTTVVDSIADEVPTPGLMITSTNTTNYIIITNGVSFANYELYRRPAFEAGYPWTLHTIGTMGQSNFTTTMGPFNASFFLITVGTNWDGDAFPNWVDGDPSNTNVGILSITIDSPTNGTTFN